ncbi:hypothetical protein F0U61_27910 [Archangium violaceum]|uniref:hypothetical protein n=1 Tax=Archangium violaceum TaxID=83451 RepID=UPI002B2FF7E6|nr:hypothetical protein F0U61_27910 [Archangium violaceum]
MTHARSRIPLVVAGVLSVGLLFQASAAEPKKAAPKAKAAEAKEHPGLPAPDYLPEAARTLLRKKMGRHGLDARDLMFGVTLLRYDVVRAAAQRIASEPRLVRPEAGAEDDPSTFLPERFFVLQDEVRMRAQAVAAAAEKRDDTALAESYGLLVQTCVSCHSVYLKRE